ncbi:hypothetical protein [Bacillus piscicola]|uniref:hypothetical protein n=1 Tax=Bacillus piscicola TaxID=1632684 RepID=UPI001F09DB11|nr:hypothetical protein [Bacillus piscicola]
MNKKSRLSKRIEDKFEVETYLDRLKYAIESGSVKINFQKNRRVDETRDRKYTNRYTMAYLFPDEDEIEALKRELSLLTVEDYMETVKDLRFPSYSEMRVFGKEYVNEDVYIKIRVELLNITHAAGDGFILVMSFHFAEIPLKEDDFPYRKLR